MPGWGEGRDRGRAGCLKGGEQLPRKACSNILVLHLLPFSQDLGLISGPAVSLLSSTLQSCLGFDSFFSFCC